MSNVTIFFVCAGILLLGWLIRRYQDGQWPFKTKAGQVNTMPSVANPFRTQRSLYDVVASTFPQHLVKQKIGDKDCVFLCEPVVGDGEAKEIAIVKIKPVAEKQVKSMAGLVSITYDMMPSKRELKKDLKAVL